MNVIAHAVRVTRGCVAPRPRLDKAQCRLALAASVLVWRLRCGHRDRRARRRGIRNPAHLAAPIARRRP